MTQSSAAHPGTAMDDRATIAKRRDIMTVRLFQPSRCRERECRAVQAGTWLPPIRCEAIALTTSCSDKSMDAA
jgi:hypothetical protein